MLLVMDDQADPWVPAIEQHLEDHHAAASLLVKVEGEGMHHGVRDNGNAARLLATLGTAAQVGPCAGQQKQEAAIKKLPEAT
jgi:hypothetical protein